MQNTNKSNSILTPEPESERVIKGIADLAIAGIIPADTAVLACRKVREKAAGALTKKSR
ncbi:MAG: hypothetical protein AB7W16_11110 [Candidatus Obscuribacterales bacterium]